MLFICGMHGKISFGYKKKYKKKKKALQAISILKHLPYKMDRWPASWFDTHHCKNQNLALVDLKKKFLSANEVAYRQVAYWRSTGLYVCKLELS